ncbi:MAG: PrsW family intramembrane metalloprotease [Pirellulales bacterium]|nr:PrsW family intramembrane metalloprotease [Pirellulales bacterium]
MTCRHYLQTKTRSPAFLWRMVIGLLIAGVIIGLAVDFAVPAWIGPQAGLFADKSPDDPLEGPPHVLEQLADRGRWSELWMAIPGRILDRWRHPGVTGLAVLTGLCWLAFVLQAIQIRRGRDSRLWLPLAGLGLGVLSVWPTFFLIYWQERTWNLADSTELAAGLRCNILGVGLREEAAKFLCFLPLLPWLVRRRDELAALLCAGAVGIGFGMEENVGYVGGSGGAETLGRLLTPVPIHMAITGLVGLAAYRACLWPLPWGPHFMAVFGVAVLAHGMYDALLSITALEEYAFGSYLIFVLLVYQFFHELRPLQKRRIEPVSLTANFLFCVSTVAAATFVYLCAAVGWQAACDVLVSGIVAQSLMVYLFLREMPETMVTV